MSQRSQRRNIKKSRLNSSKEEELSQVASQSQSQPQSNLEIDTLVQKCIRLFLTKMNSNIPIRRTQIAQHLFTGKAGKTFEIVIERTQKILQEVYGLKLVINGEDTANKRYFVINDLENPELIEKSPEECFKRNLTFLVLTHIFMSKYSTNEISLWDFLRELDITPEQKMLKFGTVETFVMKQLVKEQFITLEQTGTTNEDGETKKKFGWGSHAEKYVSKMDILKFVAKMYGNTNVKFWPSRYENAVEQFGDDN